MEPGSRYAIFLRGVNVGGKAKVPMAELRRALDEAGLPGSASYLQSGNVVVPAACSPVDLGLAVTKVLKESFGVKGDVVVKDEAEMAAVVEENPLPERAATNGSRYFVVFAAEPIDDETRAAINHFDFSPDEVVVARSEVYMWCNEGISKSPCGTYPWARTIGSVVTTRNWNTVTKVREMLRSESSK
jgi:uncharacterized protein (DUF1697 family)